jgi:hypothetical protein
MTMTDQLDVALDAKLKQTADLVQLSKDNLRHLQTARVDAERRLHAMAEERAALSYAAHTGDAKAKEELNYINSASVTGTLEVENLNSAVAEAERLLAKSEQDHAVALEHVRAAETLDHISALIEAGTATDNHLQGFIAEFNRLEHLCVQIFGFCGTPNRDQTRVLGRRALASLLLSRRDVFGLEMLAPGERVTFSGLAQQWATLARSICEKKLGIDRSEAAE